MNSGAFWELGDVTDRDLQAELTRLLASGSRTEARIIAHLAAVEERRLHLEAGSSSLFDYCLHRLGLSESWLRIEFKVEARPLWLARWPMGQLENFNPARAGVVSAFPSSDAEGWDDRSALRDHQYPSLKNGVGGCH
jgi:hypothetical protein